MKNQDSRLLAPGYLNPQHTDFLTIFYNTRRNATKFDFSWAVSRNS